MTRRPKTEEELQQGLECAMAAQQQMHDKKGPIYEKWLSRTQAAREERRQKQEVDHARP